MKKELKKVKKLLRNGYIPISSGEQLLYVYNKLNGDLYVPKTQLIIL